MFAVTVTEILSTSHFGKNADTCWK